MGCRTGTPQRRSRLKRLERSGAAYFLCYLVPRGMHRTGTFAAGPENGHARIAA